MESETVNRVTKGALASARALVSTSFSVAAGSLLLITLRMNNPTVAFSAAIVGGLCVMFTALSIRYIIDLRRVTRQDADELGRKNFLEFNSVDYEPDSSDIRIRAQKLHTRTRIFKQIRGLTSILLRTRGMSESLASSARIFAFVGIWIIYPTAWNYTGFIVPTAVACYLSLIVLKAQRKVVAAMGAGVVAVFLFWMIEEVLNVPLPMWIVDEAMFELLLR